MLEPIQARKLCKICIHLNVVAMAAYLWFHPTPHGKVFAFAAMCKIDGLISSSNFKKQARYRSLYTHTEVLFCIYIVSSCHKSHAMCLLWTVDFSGLRINYDFYKKPGALASCFARFGTFHGLVDLLTSLSF